MERSVISFNGQEINQFQIEKLLYPNSKISIGGGYSGLGENDKISIEEMVENYEKQIISEYLEKYNSATKVAEALMMNRTTLFRRMQKYNLE